LALSSLRFMIADDARRSAQRRDGSSMIATRSSRRGRARIKSRWTRAIRCSLSEASCCRLSRDYRSILAVSKVQTDICFYDVLEWICKEQVCAISIKINGANRCMNRESHSEMLMFLKVQRLLHPELAVESRVNILFREICRFCQLECNETQ